MVLTQDSYLRFGPYLDLMTGIHTALKINEGIIKVVAPEGCGKTVFCRELVRDLVNDGQEVIFFESPPESVDYLHKRIQSELDLPRDKDFTRSLTQYLLAKSPPRNKLTLIYDDAEKISKEIFILIRLLNNVHNDAETLVSQVICGTDKLDKVFDDPDLRSLTQYLNQSFTLPPMTREEMEDFCSGYLQQAGITDKALTSKQLTDIFMAGKGMPGKTMELMAHQVSVSQGASSSPAPLTGEDNEVSVADSVPAPSSSARDEVASHYAREVDQILDEDTGYQSKFPMYFKLVLSVIVVVSTLVLAVVLSGDNETVNDRIAEILADDSPLYLDEVVDPVTVETAQTSEPDFVPVDMTDPAPDVIEESVTLASTDNVLTEPVAALPSPVEPAVSNDPEPADTELASADVSFIEDQTPEAALTEPAEDAVTPGIDLEVDETMPDAEQLALVNEESATDVVTDAPEVVEAQDPALSTTDALDAVIAAWTEAWQAGDFDGYISAYDEDFTATNYDSLQAWETARRPRVEGVSGMMISYDRFDLVAEDTGQATARFWLSYSRGNYADDTLKEIVFLKEGEQWRIVEERNLEIIVK